MSGRYTPQVQEAITRLGGRLPYGEAEEELQLMWGIEISRGGVRGVTMRHGQTAETIVDEVVEELVAEAPVATAEPKKLLMSVDGAMVQLTSGEWREVKMMAIGEFKSQWDTKAKQVVTQTDNISYFSRVESAEAFTQSSLYEWHRRGGEKAQQVVTVNDGALWIQSLVDYHCPKARRVLDFAHAKGYLATIGKAIYGAESAEFKPWFARISHQLGHQPPQRTLSELHLLQSQHQDHPLIAEIEVAIRYLEKRQEMIDYTHFRQQQIPIGSGMVESGHKVVMQRRLKQAGMRWAEENLNPMLALRTAICNGNWATVWQDIQAHSHQSKRQHRLQQVTQPEPTPSSTLVTEQDCQRLLQLADEIDQKSKHKHPWHNHDWIFPHRRDSLHQN